MRISLRWAFAALALLGACARYARYEAPAAQAAVVTPCMDECMLRVGRAAIQSCLRACPGVIEEEGTCADAAAAQDGGVCRQVQTRRSSVVSWVIVLGIVTFAVVAVLATSGGGDGLFDPDKH